MAKTENDGAMMVVEIKAKRTMAGPGMDAFDAEAVVSETGKNDVYVHVNEYDMFKHYVVSEKSLMDTDENGNEMTDAEKEAFDEELARIIRDGVVDSDVAIDSEYIEEYSKLTDAKKSKYGDVFSSLSKVIGMLR